MATESTRSRATRDVVRQLLGRVVNLGLGIVVTAVVARGLGDSGFGEWSSLLVVVQIAAYFADLGLEQVGVRKAAAEPEREAQWIGAAIALRAVVSLPATLISIVVALLIADNQDMAIGGLLVSTTILLSGPNTARALLQLRLRNDVNVAVMTFSSVVWGAAAIAVSAAGGGLVPLAIAFLAAALATTALQVWLGLRAGAVELLGSRHLWRPLARVGLPLATGGVLVLAYARIDQILVLELVGTREAGLYAAVYRILEQAHFLPLTVSTTLLPLVSAAYPSDPPRVRELLQTTAEYLALVSLPALGVALAASGPAIELLFGGEFAAAAPALPVLMGAFVVICFGYLSGNMIVVLGLQRRFVLYASLGLVVNVGLNLVLLPRYGFLAAAWTTLATELAVVGLAWRAVMSELDFRLALGRVYRAAAATAAMTLLLLGLRAIDTPAVPLLLAAAVSYPLLALALRAVSLDELRQLRALRRSSG
ncbi:MAG TPA: flippase [Solirubrobacterales bacterium]|jgi:O-antigen/teichoic acid export membrane protein|nr:flippase [Solirubrobacterales bacterium]